MSPIKYAAAIAAAIILMPSLSNAFDDAEALRGMQEGKIAFDLTDDNGKLLLSRLDIIDETRQSLLQQGVIPHFAITFRGPASRLVQTDLDKVAPDDRDIAVKIAAKIETMSKETGVEHLEQCSVAARELGINPAKMLPPIKMVGNGFISLMAYQSKGYAYIRP
jgi:intracellular sulfur oxidation DsrE/DsrF family protein